MCERRNIMSMEVVSRNEFAPVRKPGQTPLEILKRRAEMNKMIKEQQLMNELLEKREAGELTKTEKLQLDYMIACRKVENIADAIAGLPTVCYMV